MSVGMHPVDGLIYRLLQQNNKPMYAAGGKSSDPAPADQVTLSSAAREGQSALTAEQGQKPSERALESHLLNLYRLNDRYGG